MMTNVRRTLEALLAKRILVLDGFIQELVCATGEKSLIVWSL